ncbi:MAG: HEAT repeat domain-containing protein [Roseibacillus sp.]
MKVHRCPHCTKPFLKSEARAGKCPVCQKVVWDTPEPKPETNSEPEAEHDSGPGAPEQPDQSKTPKSPRRSVSIAIPLLLIVILGGGALWWFQVQDLQAQRDDLQEQLSQAEGKRGVAAHRGSAARVRKRPASTPIRAPIQGQLSGRMQAALAVIKTTPNHKASQTTLSAGMQRDRTWIAQVGALMPPPHWAIPTLTGLLRDPRPETRQLAAEALGRIRAPGAIVQAFLEGTTRDSDALVRKAALEALTQIRSGE